MAARRDETGAGVFDSMPHLRTLLALSPRAVARKLRARGWSERRSVVVACDAARPAPAPPAAHDLTVAVCDPTAFPDLTSTLPGASNEDALSLAAMERTRAEAAGDLVVARCGEELAGLHFIHTRAHQPRLERVAPQLYEPLGPDEALTEGIFVFPAFRGHGVGPSMLRASLSRLAHHGFRRGLAVIDVENRSSLRAFHAAGYVAQPMMRVDTFRFGRRSSAYMATDAATWRRYREATGA